ncbi:MAG: hypothetical protein AB7K68_06105 [Bacteriovoracia bacterium]
MFISRLLQKLSLVALLAAALSISRVTQLVDSWFGFIPLLFVFAGFVLGFGGWGRYFALRMGRNGLADTALFSSLLAVASAYFFGHLGFLGEMGRWFGFALLTIGIFLGRKEIPWPKSSWISAILGVVIALRFFNAFLPIAHGDPFIYHLLGPRLWVDLGSVRMHPQLPNALLASAWEYFYLWPQLLFARSGEIHGLVAAQIFSQWIHLLWGWIGIPLVADALFFPRGGRARDRFLVFLSLLFVTSLQWTGGLSKNDCGVAFWALGAFLFWVRAFDHREESDWKNYVFAGIFFGLAIAAKLNAAIFLAPAFAISFLFFVARGGYLAKALGLYLSAMVSLLTASAFFLRNFYLTKNPFFPMFQNRFPSPWVSQSWADNFATVHPNENLLQFGVLGERVGSLLRESPMMAGWLLLPFLFFRPQSRDFLRNHAMYLAIAFFTFLIFSFSFSGNIEIRYLGANLPLMAALGTLLFCEGLNFLSEYRAEKVGVTILVIAILACSHLPFHLLVKAIRIPPGIPYLLTHTAGDSKAWLRDNAGKGELIVLMADNETYYLSGLRVTVLTERPDIDFVTYGEKDFAKFMRGLCSSSRGTYLLDARTNIGLALRFPGKDLSSALLFRGISSNVYDLGKLERLAYGDVSACASAAK